MNLSEFKAWFEGFTEDMDGPPNTKQWKRIRARVKEITADPTPWPIVYHRYVEPIRPYWQGPTWAGTSGNMGGLSNTQAFNMVGQAEAKQISA